jgi:hypothetical protein
MHEVSVIDPLDFQIVMSRVAFEQRFQIRQHHDPRTPTSAAPALTVERAPP